MNLIQCSSCDVKYNPEYALHYCYGLGGVSTGYVPTTTVDTSSSIHHFTCICCGNWISSWGQHFCPGLTIKAPSIISHQEEPLANNIDEQQITLLDNMRSARDAAYRYAQSKHDRATLMRIQADALEAEGNEIVSEINEGVPAPESE